MLRLELVENTQEEIVYSYFPEGESEYGTISINKVTGELDIKKTSANDAYKRYLFHAVSRIEKYYAENKFLERDIVAWC